jgi:hypothetical protein
MKPPRPSRREAKALRTNLKAAAEQEGKIRLIERVSLPGENLPRQLETPTDQNRQPRVQKDPAIIWSMKMTWCISEGDVEGAWSWHEPRQWTASEFERHIKSTLDVLTGSTWHEIHQMRSGGLSNHHAQAISSLIDEAQRRWEMIGMAVDETFRFRLSGRQRAWGYREGAHFKMVWYDRYHKIYPVDRKHT